MENIKIFLDGVQKDVSGLFYVYEGKYYFIYTEKEVDGEYIILYMSQVGKETQNTPNGPVDTGYMIGVEITDPEEQKKVQTSISYIVEDKKNNTLNPQIQYIPISAITNLKIIGKKRFRLLKSIIVDNFKLSLDNLDSLTVPIVSNEEIKISQPIESQNEVQQNEPALQQETEQKQSDLEEESANVIVDYRTRYFEESEKNKQLQAQIDMLTQKIEEIKKIVE